MLTLQNGSRFLFGGKNPRTFCLCDCQSSKVTYGNIDEETGLWKKSDSPGNCDLNGGVITGGTRSAFWIQNLTLNMYGGNIAGNALGVSINYRAAFSLYGGSITGNANSGSVSEDKGNTSYGGGVYVGQGTFSMQGGSISRNSSSQGGGVYVKGNTCTIQGGSITGNNTSGNGGGVYVTGGECNLAGGTVSQNKSDSNGGGVCVTGGKCNLTGGAVSQNESGSLGGGVFVNRGSFSMTAGEISGNQCRYHGGGIHLRDGSHTISGGSITGNRTGSEPLGENHPAGGGICVDYDAQLTLSGPVKISGNTAVRGGGVYINQETLKLSGEAVLSGNTGDDLYLRNYDAKSNAAVELTSPLPDGWKISVTMYTPGVAVTNWKDRMGDKDPADYLDMRANPGYHIGINGDGAATLLANIYTVEFLPNGGSGSIYEQRFFYDAAQNLTLNKFTRTGYTFAGWSVGNTTYTDGQEVKNLTAENNGVIALVAQWQANTYNVTLNPNGGSINSGDVTSYTYGTSKELPTDVTRTGYTFQGWYDNESLTGSPATRITAADLGDKVFWAKWQANNYTVTLHPNEGKIDGSTPDGDGNYVLQYTYGAGAALPAEKKITRSGYYFGGWYDNEKLEGKPVTEITAADLGHKEFWAKWYYISDTSTYSVILPDNVEGGKVTAAKGYAEEGEIVRLTVTPEEGYVLSALTVTRSNGGKLTLTEEGEGVWSFRMPASQVTVEAVFAPSALPFTDVPEGAWYRSAVWYAYTHGLMNGVSDTTFAPGSTTSRAMIVTILWRQAGSPVVNYAMDFDDVSQGQWYSEAIRWAASEGIAGGYGDGRFGTDDPITREQFAAMLYRYAQKQGYDVSIGEETNILSYIDAQEISEYAIPAMQWACGAGVIQGDGNALNPQGYAARSEAAAMLMRFCKNMEK